MLERGSVALLLGNEAIARAAIEAGVGFAAAYPGTPSTEVVESLAEVAKEIGMHVEWSTNEKVSFEAAYAASIAGVRALVAMKHVGLNVASDILMSSAYTGVNSGLLVVSADDPSQHSSQNEQDNRWYGLLSHLPVVEPWCPRNAYRLTKVSYEISEKYRLPVILRTTTRLSHTRQPIVYEADVPREVRTRGSFKKDVERYVLVPAHSRKLKEALMKKWEEIREDLGVEPFISIENPGLRRAIVASGISYAHVDEALNLMNMRNDFTVVRVSMPVPLPVKPMKELLSYAKSILVVEELDPVVELQLSKIVVEESASVELYGKDYVPANYELSLEIVYKSIKAFLGEEPSAPWSGVEPVKLEPQVPPRPPTLCPGCPHRNTFYVAKVAANKAGVRDLIYTGDIGCYTLGYLPPFRVQDTSLEMGGSIGVAHGLSLVVEDTVIAVIGDSTFYHAGLPPSINVVYNGGRALILVLDNLCTAMTGHQPHPGTGLTATGEKAERMFIEDFLKSMGFKTYVIDPMNVGESIGEFVKAYREHLSGKHVAVVSRMKCALEVLRAARARGIALPKYAITDACTGCMACVNLLGCPAIVVEEGSRKPRILEEACAGCGLCAYVCPYDAIVVSREGGAGWRELWH